LFCFLVGIQKSSFALTNETSEKEDIFSYCRPTENLFRLLYS